jgi:O-antigen/teichoic acid export membrane protein
VTELKLQAYKGMFWSTIDKFAGQAGQFAVGIVMARLLMPKDYGSIAMLSIFFAISQSFINSGMGSGLVQKKDRSEIDFSTVFVFNMVVSVIFYILLFLSAPWIAEFYKTPQLISLTRILSITIVINALSIVQISKLNLVLDFKTMAKVNLISVIVGGLIGIIVAYLGWGVWALVVKAIVSAVLSVSVLWVVTKWKPSIRFSRQSFNDLFGYGSKILLAGLYSQAFQNIYNIVIGKAYSASDLGYYERAKGYAELTSGTVSSILLQVTFPILASLQNEKERMVSIYRRLIGMTSFFIFPVMTLFALLADPLVRLLLTEKWAPTIILLQWICFARIVTPISSVNMSILKAIGRSDLFLKVDLSKLPLIILALIITIPMGVKAMVIGHVVTSGISYFINAYMPGKLFGYGALKQIQDLLPTLISTGAMAATVFLLTSVTENLLLKLILGSFSGISSYLFVCYLFKMEELNEIKTLIAKFKLKR